MEGEARISRERAQGGYLHGIVSGWRRLNVLPFDWKPAHGGGQCEVLAGKWAGTALRKRAVWATL